MMDHITQSAQTKERKKIEQARINQQRILKHNESFVMDSPDIN